MLWSSSCIHDQLMLGMPSLLGIPTGWGCEPFLNVPRYQPLVLLVFTGYTDAIGLLSILLQMKV